MDLSFVDFEKKRKRSDFVTGMMDLMFRLWCNGTNLFCLIWINAFTATPPNSSPKSNACRSHRETATW